MCKIQQIQLILHAHIRTRNLQFFFSTHFYRISQPGGVMCLSLGCLPRPCLHHILLRECLIHVVCVCEYVSMRVLAGGGGGVKRACIYPSPSPQGQKRMRNSWPVRV